MTYARGLLSLLSSAWRLSFCRLARRVIDENPPVTHQDAVIGLQLAVGFPVDGQTVFGHDDLHIIAADGGAGAAGGGLFPLHIDIYGSASRVAVGGTAFQRDRMGTDSILSTVYLSASREQQDQTTASPYQGLHNAIVRSHVPLLSPT